MKKKALMVLMTAVLTFSGVLSPACMAAAEENTQKEESAQTEDAAQAEEINAQAEDTAQTEETAKKEADNGKEKNLLEQGTQIGEDLYKKMDEAVDGIDKKSLRRSIREALEQMDQMGISPSSVAENVLGIRTKYKSGEKAPENTLIKDAQNAVQKKTEGFFTVLWDGFLDTLESIITNGISIFSGFSDSGGGGKGL